MDQVNPKFILRNYLMQQAIVKAEKDDMSGVEDLLKHALDPFNDQDITDDKTFIPPKWAYDLCVSCSS